MKMYQGSTDELSDHIPNNPSMRYRHDDEQSVRVQYIEPAEQTSSKTDEELSEVVSEVEDCPPALIFSTKEEICQAEDCIEEEDDQNINKDNEVEQNIVQSYVSAPSVVEENSHLPDYNRMYLWESGQMDYTGSDASSNIMKKLDALILK